MSGLERLPTKPMEQFSFTNIRDGDVFDLGGIVLEAILVPGHTKGSVCFFDRAHNQRFTGDAVNKPPWTFGGRCGTVASYLESLTRLRGMTASQPDIFCGHAWDAYPYRVLLNSITVCEEVLAGSSATGPHYLIPFEQNAPEVPDVYEHQVGDVRLCYSTKYPR